MPKSSGKIMKIGFVFDDSLDRDDGVQQQLKLLGHWLSRRGHDVVYLVGETKLSEYKGSKVYSISRNVKVTANQNQFTLPKPVSPDKIRRILTREKFDRLHIMLPFSPWLGLKIVKLGLELDIPLYGTFHTHPATTAQKLGSWLYGRWLKRYLERFQAVTSVSSATQNYVQRYFGVSSQVIPNCIDLARFARGKSLEALTGQKTTILFLGRLTERKGAQHLLEAAAILKRQGRLVGRQLIICGSGPLYDQLSRRVTQLRMTGQVLMPGYIAEADKPDYLASADLAVFPAAKGEAFGIVLLESMAAGTLTLGGLNVGYQSVLGGQPKLLVNPADHPGLAARIDKLLSDSLLRERLLAWQATAVQGYDVNRVGPAIESLYYQLPT